MRSPEAKREECRFSECSNSANSAAVLRDLCVLRFSALRAEHTSNERTVLPCTNMIVDALHRIANHCQSLSRDEARRVMSEVLTGQCTDAQIAALLVALHMKGETVEEIVGFAEAIRAAATPLVVPGNSMIDVSGTERDALVDTCGTGGDASGTFNISTATALVTAGAGVRVAKHGNRSVTSKCGSADVMEALGVNINLPASKMANCLKDVGIAFLFAPAMHSAMKYVQPARR
jgi:anthranilate phosphoribosyltransferase